MEFEILRRYREDSAPKNLTKLDDKPISVFKREELLELAERREISISELCKIGAIEDKIENWIVLVHYAIVIAKEKTLKRPIVTNDQDKSDSVKTQPGKKQKMASVTMEELRQEVGELKKQLEEHQSETLTDNLERARREAKIEASKSEVNVDLLFQKLVLLEEAATKLGHTDVEKYSILINRFHVHKNKPSFVGSLVLSSLCSKIEESILNNERKLLKNWEGEDVISVKGETDTRTKHTSNGGEFAHILKRFHGGFSWDAGK